MSTPKSLKCHKCTSVVIKLPEPDLKEITDFSFLCDYCTRFNVFSDFDFPRTAYDNSVFVFDF